MARDLFESLNKTIKDLEEGTLEIPEELKPLLERAVACQEQRKSLTPEEIEEYCNIWTKLIMGE